MSWAESYKTVEDIKAYSESRRQVGIEPSNLSLFRVKVGDGCLKINFKEPADTIIDGQTICTVKGCKIVMKEGSFPENEDDGTVVCDNTNLGYYEDNDLVVDSLTNDTEYYFQAFPYSDQMVYNRNHANRKTGTPKSYILLGFKIAKNDSNPETRVTYLEQAVGLTPARVNLSTGEFNYGDFGDFWFVTENKPYMVYNDGTEAYELNPNDYTKKADGTPSDVSNTAFLGNAMAKIPLVWLYQYEDTDFEYCYICNIQYSDNFKAYAHTRADGTIMDHIWLSCFDGALTGGKARSIKGLSPMTGQTGTAEISYSQANGALWYTRSQSQRNLINMLLILMSRSDDSQSAFGAGYYTGASSNSPNWLPTGYGSNKGQFYGTNANRDVVKVFHIENWWGQTWERIAGLMYVSGTIRTKSTPPYNTTAAGYENTGITIGGTSGGYCSKTKMTPAGRLPVTMSGSESTYTCDGGWFNANQVDYAFVGGCGASGRFCGASCVDLNNLVSGAGWAFGSALSCEQPSA